MSYEEGLATARAIRATRYLGEFPSSGEADNFQNARRNIIGESKKQSTKRPRSALVAELEVDQEGKVSKTDSNLGV